MGFTNKVAAPGVEPFDIQVTSMELVQENYLLLINREDTCHRTCFSLQLDGTTLDNFAELKTVEGLKEDSLIQWCRKVEPAWEDNNIGYTCLRHIIYALGQSVRVRAPPFC